MIGFFNPNLSQIERLYLYISNFSSEILLNKNNISNVLFFNDKQISICKKIQKEENDLKILSQKNKFMFINKKDDEFTLISNFNQNIANIKSQLKTQTKDYTISQINPINDKNIINIPTKTSLNKAKIFSPVKIQNFSNITSKLNKYNMQKYKKIIRKNKIIINNK